MYCEEVMSYGNIKRSTAYEAEKKFEKLIKNLTEAWIEEVWFPSLPDSNPFDCFVCGVSE